jgi:hypothetical protein
MAFVRAALKEWAVVEEAMSRGSISLLLRKGGIWEPREGFRVEHPAFWIFPGVFHQQPAELAEHLRKGLEGYLETSEPDPVPLRLLARVEEVVRLTDPAAVDSLHGLHPLTPEAARNRFLYRGKPCLHALLLRIHVLPAPVPVRNSLAYLGCRSWLELNEAISAEGAAAVLDDAAFAGIREELWRRLDGRGELLELANGRAR